MIWLGAATAAVVLLYLLRPPARRFLVPSTLLWERLVERTRKRRRWLRWLLSLLLSLLFVLLLVATLFRIEPRFGTVTDPVILIDNTGSMGTRLDDDPEATRLDRARALARTLLEESSGSMTVADLAGTFGPATFQSLDEASRALDRIRWRPDLPARLPSLFLRADESAQRTIYLLTDRPDPWKTSRADSPLEATDEAPSFSGWTLVDLSSPAENLGFVTLSTSAPRRDVLGAPMDSAFLEILNGGTQAHTARLLVDVLSSRDLEDEDSQPARLLERDLDIAPGSTWTGVLDLSRAYALAAERSPARQLVLRARVTSTGTDHQPADDVAWLVLEEGRVTIDGSRRAEVRRWPRWLTRVLETSERLEVITRSGTGAIRISGTAPTSGDDGDVAPCLVLPTTGEAAEIPLQRAMLQLPGQAPLPLPWTAVAIAAAGDADQDTQPGGAPDTSWLIGLPRDPGTEPVALVSGPDPVSGCVRWSFDPEAAHLETRPEFPALAESVLLALAGRRAAGEDRPEARTQVWLDGSWTAMNDQFVGSLLLRAGDGLRASSPLGPDATRVSTTGDHGPTIQRVEPESVARRAGSPWPRRSVLLGLLALLVLFEAGTRLAGWTE